MENALLVGDRVLVNRIGFAAKSSWLGPLLPYRDIGRGDIVVFLSPQTPGLHVVKRIIGLPGVRIHLRNGVVYRNGERLDEPYVLHDADNPNDEYRNNFPVAALPTIPTSTIVGDGNCLPTFREGTSWPRPMPTWPGRSSRRQPRQPPLGIYSRGKTSLDVLYSCTGRSRRPRRNMRGTRPRIAHFLDETRWRRTLQAVR
jgi:signal peptidase I